MSVLLPVAEVPLTVRGRQVEKLFTVEDPDRPAPVVVRWHLRDADPWRCSVCGPMPRADCAHTFAAAMRLADRLLGLTALAAPAPAPAESPHTERNTPA